MVYASEVFFAAIIAVSSVSDATMPMQALIGARAAANNLFAVIDETSATQIRTKPI